MRFALRGAALVAALLLGGCAAQTHQTITEFKRTKPQPRILVMPLDVELFELSAAGLPEPKDDWTEAARTHLEKTLREYKAARGVVAVDYAAERVREELRDEHEQLVKVHGAVGKTILVTSLLPLPTKQGKLDWTLGPVAKTLKDTYDADYAMFVFVRDSYSSPGRVAVIVVAAAFGVAVPGGTQIGFASLVDLDTGDIVWFNRLARGVGDLRTEPAARETVDVLLGGLPK
jgi:hypothetical protein